MLEVRLLKAENGMLRKKTHEFSALNENLREEVLVLDKKEKEASTNLEDLTKLVEEFEEESARKARKMLMGVEKSTNAALELQAKLNQKEDELKYAKVKKCDYIVQLDVAEKELKSFQIKGYHGHHTVNQTGRFPNQPITCYFCAKMGHTKARCFRFKRFIASEFRTRVDPPKVKQIWVRKDLVCQVRPMGRDTTYRHLAPIWVVKKHVLPNPVKPPLIDRVSLAY